MTPAGRLLFLVGRARQFERLQREALELADAVQAFASTAADGELMLTDDHADGHPFISLPFGSREWQRVVAAKFGVWSEIAPSDRERLRQEAST